MGADIMIQVTSSVAGQAYIKVFPDSYITKVLQSGALRVSRAFEADVPMLDDEDGKAEDMVATQELTVAVFYGDYIMERIEE